MRQQHTTATTRSTAEDTACGLRLALFLPDLDGGGAERMMVQLAGGCADAGATVDLVLASARGPYLDELPANVNLVDLEARSTSGAIVPLTSYLRRVRPDVLLATLHHASLAAAIAHRVAHVPTLLYVREATTPSNRSIELTDVKGRLIALGMRWAYARANGVIAVSEGVADDLRRHRNVPDAKLWTLYNPVVTDDVPAKAAVDPGHRWLAPDGPKVVLGVGGLQSRKDFRTLLTAFARVRESRDSRLIILGDGPERSDLSDHARSLGIAESVDLPGFVANPFAYMARAAVFVLSSEREGLPGVLIQAMACGCPVVATDCRSGPREILDGGRLGALVPVGDATAMAQAIEHALVSPRESPRLVERASLFASDRVVAAYLRVFEAAVRLQQGDGRA